MTARRKATLRTLVTVLCAAALGLAAAPARADDLPPPQVRRSSGVPLPPLPPRVPLRPRAVPAPRPTPVVDRPAPLAARTGLPSEPQAARRARSHTTYVPPLGATGARAPAPRPTATRGRVPTTTFRVAPAPRPRAVLAEARPAPLPIARVPRTRAPRTTTWNPRPVPVPPSAAPARTRTATLPSPTVRAASPSYADVVRTQAHLHTSRPYGESSATPLRTLQRRGRTARGVRRALRSNELSVPMAPGQAAPRPPVRRTLELRLPPGCSGDT